jgi:hypothetical protein
VPTVLATQKEPVDGGLQEVFMAAHTARHLPDAPRAAAQHSRLNDIACRGIPKHA